MQERPGQIGDYWLSQRPGSKQWCRTWYDADARQTKRASLGTDNFQEGKLKLWEWFAKHGRLGQQQPQEAALELLLVRYYEQHAAALPSREVARAALGYWSDFFAGATVSELTPARQREFMESLRASGKSEGYIKRIMTVGKSALNRAYKEGEIASVPYVIPGKDAPPRDLVLTMEQSRRLWDAVRRPHEQMFLALAYCTLARPEAILGLTRAQVDLARRRLTQNPPGREQTKKYRPTVPICDFLLPVLEDAPDGPLVHWWGHPIDSFKTAWRALRERAKLPKEAVAKTIRHTMATELRQAGVSEAEIQGMLGHRAYSGRTEVYAKYRPDYLGHATRVIDDYMRRLRVSCVLVGSAANEPTSPKGLIRLVGGTGFEPVTPTMSR